MTNLPLPFDLLYRYKSSEGLVGLNLLKKYLITNLHRQNKENYYDFKR
jgi:hypothetical protein